MSFLAPGAFFLGLLLPVIVAMYLLKLRRTEREVPSTYLWRRMVRDVEANAPWQRLRRNLLLLLQLLFLAALIFALARPFTYAQGTGGQAAIFILDTSASMRATDVQPSRLEAAKERARQMVDELPEGARVTVIAAGEKAEVRLASNQDRRQAHQALEGIQAGYGGSDMAVALELASAIAARQPDTSILVFSDGGVHLPARLALKGNLQYLPMGISGENQAISLLSLQSSHAGENLTAFAQVSNYGDATATRRLALYADGQPLNAYDLQIPPKGQQAVLAEDVPAGTQLLEARLDGQDALPDDDRALAVGREASNAQVTLVTAGNLFLERATDLLLGQNVQPLDPTNLPASLPTADLTIFDAYVPITQTMPAGNLLFIAPPRSSEFFTVTGTVENPTMRVVDPDEPLLKQVNLGQVGVLDASAITLPTWADAVVAGDTASGSTPLLFRGEVGGRRVAVLAFDLHRSDLPLQMAFPLLWANLMDWLAPGSQGNIPAQVNPGENISFALPAGADSVTVTRPDGERLRLEPVDGRITFADTGELGRYDLQWGLDGSASFTVNLFLPQESELKPLDALPGLQAEGQGEAAVQQQGRREWWRPLALLALGLLSGEWLVYQRAALARLRDKLRSIRLLKAL